MNLSEHLEDLRKQHDLTQDQLAEKLTVTRQAISRWERGLAYPTVDNLKALAQLYQVSLDTLLLDEPPESVEPAPAEAPEPTQPAPATAPESAQPAPHPSTPGTAGPDPGLGRRSPGPAGTTGSRNGAD